MNEYLLINLLIISFPLMATFYPRIAYYKKIPAVFTSILSVSSLYILWDIFATARGDWAFNPTYVLGIKFSLLPLEEVLFFITVPYSCLFIHESLQTYFKDREVPFRRNIYVVTAVFIFLLSLPYVKQDYTFTVLAVTASFMLLGAFHLQEMLSSKLYWIYIMITMFLFVVFNYLLTSMPIVTYNSEAIWGLRILTIPVEDFFYNYSMLSMYLAVYLWTGKRFYLGNPK
ncbi:MAG: lycopene cyclase domain-containing protein [Candidatus Altiarchaeota archaeon]|nr:lycopene cyclase domain-containing protein [Candidatus Altiarchaeota archaeon]